MTFGDCYQIPLVAVHYDENQVAPRNDACVMGSMVVREFLYPPEGLGCLGFSVVWTRPSDKVMRDGDMNGHGAKYCLDRVWETQVRRNEESSSRQHCASCQRGSGQCPYHSRTCKN
jgi:hypothetical protein